MDAASPIGIGHVNLKVMDLDRSVAFYCDVLGFRIAQRRPGSSLAFLTAGTAAFDLALTTNDTQAGEAPAGHTGLDHLAVRYPTRRALARAYRRLLAYGITPFETDEHGAMESLYFHDPDGIQVEIYWEYPRERWAMENGRLRMYVRPLDTEDLLAELDHIEATDDSPD